MKKNNTFAPNPNKVEKKWHFVNAQNKVLGRLASDIAHILMGKHKVEYVPNQDLGDNVVVTNAKDIMVTGKKLKDKKYIKHTGFPGGLKEESLGDLLKRQPTKVLKNAVYGMLPKNKLRDSRIKNLYIYEGSEHPHKAQEGKQEEK